MTRSERGTDIGGARLLAYAGPARPNGKVKAEGEVSEGHGSGRVSPARPGWHRAGRRQRTRRTARMSQSLIGVIRTGLVVRGASITRPSPMYMPTCSGRAAVP